MAPWALVIPVKRLHLAKTRLALLAGELRSELALAFAADTAAAAVACPSVEAVFVVTDDPAAERALAPAGVRIVPDLPDAGLNPALSYGARRAVEASPDTRVAALSADLPALSASELGLALAFAAQVPRTFVADQSGHGTVLLSAHTIEDFRPMFGSLSADRHRSAGFVEIRLTGIDSLRCDVDTPADLRRAMNMGVGARTAAVAARLSWEPGSPER